VGGSYPGSNWLGDQYFTRPVSGNCHSAAHFVGSFSSGYSGHCRPTEYYRFSNHHRTHCFHLSLNSSKTDIACHEFRSCHCEERVFERRGNLS